MSKSLLEQLFGNDTESKTDSAAGPAALKQAIKQINTIEQNMLNAIDTVNEPDYIGDFIGRGGLIGLEPMGFNATPAELSYNKPCNDLAHVARTQSQLENELKNLKKRFKEIFETLNASIVEGNVSLDASSHQALTDIKTRINQSREKIKDLVLEPKPAEKTYSCFQQLDDNTQRLEQEFKHCAKLSSVK